MGELHGYQLWRDVLQDRTDLWCRKPWTFLCAVLETAPQAVTTRPVWVQIAPAIMRVRRNDHRAWPLITHAGGQTSPPACSILASFLFQVLAPLLFLFWFVDFGLIGDFYASTLRAEESDLNSLNVFMANWEDSDWLSKNADWLHGSRASLLNNLLQLKKNITRRSPASKNLLKYKM